MKDNGSNDISSRTGREVRAVIAEAVVVGSGRAGGQGCMVLEESGLVYTSVLPSSSSPLPNTQLWANIGRANIFLKCMNIIQIKYFKNILYCASFP